MRLYNPVSGIFCVFKSSALACSSSVIMVIAYERRVVPTIIWQVRIPARKCIVRARLWAELDTH